MSDDPHLPEDDFQRHLRTCWKCLAQISETEAAKAAAAEAQLRATEAANAERRIISTVMRWVAIYQRELGQCPSDVDADHSALLRRLLDGKAPLPEPPPRAFSYPWYELVDTGSGTALDVWEPNAGDAAQIPEYSERLAINQSVEWHIVERIEAIPGSRSWRVQWKGVGPIYRVEPATLYGTAVRSGKPEPWPYPGWKLTREETPNA